MSFCALPLVVSKAKGKHNPWPQSLHNFRTANPDIWQIFEAEALEHSDAILAIAAKLAKTKAKRSLKTNLSKLFQITHTLKGAAYLEGLSDLGDLAHHLEDLMLALREEQLRFNKDIRKLLVEAAEAIKLYLQSAYDLSLQPEIALENLHLKVASCLGQDASDFASAKLQSELRAFYEANPEIWDYFAPEVSENLETLEKSIASFAKDVEAGQSIYRAFHTLKGSSAIVGFSHMSELAKECETLAIAVKEEDLSADKALPLLSETKELFASMMLAAEAKAVFAESRYNYLKTRIQGALEQERNPRGS